jgi:hypothetical protein
MPDDKQLPASASEVPDSPVSDRIPKDPNQLARLVLRHNIPFSSAAVQSGYSKSLALKGQAFAVANSRAISAAFCIESAAILQDINPSTLKPLAFRRLHKEIADPDSPHGIKAIELAGRFKETDWFVKNADTNVGILLDLDVSPISEEVLDSYKDK